MRAGCRALALAVLAMAAGTARAETPRIVDVADLSAAPSRASHRVRIYEGRVRSDRASLGLLTLPVAGVELKPGGCVRLDLRGSDGPVSLLLTLATSPSDYGKRQAWRLTVNGQDAAAGVDAEPGAGVTRSLVVDLADSSPSLDVKLMCEAASSAPVTLASARVYEGLEPTTAPTPAGLRRMGLALLSPYGLGYTLDAVQMRDVFHKLPSSPYLEGQLTVLYAYSVRSAADNERDVQALAALAEQVRLPLRIAFQTHWAGTPRSVPDGAGGTFGDLPYQQITFDPDNHVVAPGLQALMGDRYDPRFGLSVPNRWGDTPWLTFNHPRLNQLRRVRLTQAVTAWLRARRKLVDEGLGRLLPPELSTGEETVYWAKDVDDSKYTEANGGKARANLMADFNPFVVADALRDGVNLDPRDGLDLKERTWLHQNLARQQQRLVDWMLDAVPAEAVRLSPAGSAYASDLIRRNIYTEPYAMPLFPLKDVSPFHPGLEVGYVLDGRSGGEYWSGAQMLPWLLRERERGRIALPNLECTGANDDQLVACLQAAYACGARFATLYNWQHRANTPALLRRFADSIAKPAGLEWPPTAAGARGGASPPAGAAAPRLEREYTAPPGAFGVNRVDLFVAASAPARLRVGLRDADPARPQSTDVGIDVPPAPADTPGTVTVALPTLLAQEPGRKYVLSVSVQGPATVARSADGAPACRLYADIARERLRSLAVADWQDTADLLDSLTVLHRYRPQSRYAREALAAAESLFTRWQPRGAYAAGIRAEQLSLPATFELPAPGGRLAPYWVTVDCPAGPVTATIKSYTDTVAIVGVRSDVPQTVTVRWGQRRTTAVLTAGVGAEIALALVPKAVVAVGSARRPVRRPGPRPTYGPPAELLSRPSVPAGRPAPAPRGGPAGSRGTPP